MSHLYITDNGSILGVDGGRYVIRQKDQLIRSIPRESIESVSIFGNSTITTPCMQQLLTSGTAVCFFSSKGRYYGRLHSVTGDKIELLKQQFAVLDDPAFSVAVSAKIAAAKIHNQQVVLKRYVGRDEDWYLRELSIIRQMEKKVMNAVSAAEIMGYEGMAAKLYFRVLGEIVRPEFRFYGRNRRPPKDAFNSMLSLGYTLLLYEIMAKLETQRLSPYCGVLHTDRDGSPALCSDLMEEWRSVIVDSAVMAMVQGNEISPDDFVFDENAAGIYLSNGALRRFINKLERKLNQKNKYLDYENREYSFRQAIHLQCGKFAEAITKKDPAVYHPVRIR
ncbi:CRISPR-associated endonuclease Cas1 [Hornefia butyriciproducens]|uniref:CRISPR-associated endonuclease Cas1 n=1 Tax=Hornefia butyriciproducens TaxID=2652293 RepID=UPI002A91A9A5|nr:CRISPR-associated endonuclease Cas1 [Hornefia butyriciproducens]MDY5422688.1 CRISPR-associated endonuclease Cas1 [Hornefia butyriciproducens]